MKLLMRTLTTTQAHFTPNGRESWTEYSIPRSDWETIGRPVTLNITIEGSHE